jgi:hypothetical protein
MRKVVRYMFDNICGAKRKSILVRANQNNQNIKKQLPITRGRRHVERWARQCTECAGRDQGGIAGGTKGGEGGAAGDNTDFEFLLDGCSTTSMLPADELFSEGKLALLHIPDEKASSPAAITTTSGELGGETRVGRGVVAWRRVRMGGAGG